MNLFALMALVLHFGPWLKAHVPRIARMEKLGAASLSVFLAQLLVVLLTLAIFGDQPLAHAVWVDALILVACFAILVLTATFTLWMDQKPWQLRKALPIR